MKTIQTEVLIQAPVDLVWKTLTNFSDYSNWNPFIRQIKGTATLGAKLSVTIAPEGNKPMTFKPTIITLIDNQEL